MPETQKKLITRTFHFVVVWSLLCSIAAVIITGLIAYLCQLLFVFPAKSTIMSIITLALLVPGVLYSNYLVFKSMLTSKKYKFVVTFDNTTTLNIWLWFFSRYLLFIIPFYIIIFGIDAATGNAFNTFFRIINVIWVLAVVNYILETLFTKNHKSFSIKIDERIPS